MPLVKIWRLRRRLNKQGHVQVRTHDGELRWFHTVTEAFINAEQDPEVWKISWSEGRGKDRKWIRLVRYDVEGLPHWLYEPMKRFIDAALSDGYASRSDGHRGPQPQ